MNPAMRQRYSEVLTSFPLPANCAALEIGAVGRLDRDIIGLIDTEDRVGVNLAPPRSADFPVLSANSNNLGEAFEDDRFDLVVCNAVLEHDPYFWCTVAEIKRVLKPGGLALIGVPGYTQRTTALSRLAETLYRRGKRSRFRAVRAIAVSPLLGALNFTTTLPYHSGPVDCYRFSRDGIAAILSDFDVLLLEEIHRPARIFAVARHPHRPDPSG